MSLSDGQIKNILLEMGVEADFGLAESDKAVPSGSFCGTNGVWESVEQAVRAVASAQKQFSRLPIRVRAEVITKMRAVANENAELLARMAQEETGYGKVSHKILKNKLAAGKTPGIEDLVPKAYSGDDGLTLAEAAPYGVIGAITPSTNPTATVINNSLSMVAGANGVVFNPHPAAKRASNEAVKILNRAICEVCGVEGLLATVAEPSAQTGRELMEHPQIRILAVTGGEAVVRLAMKSGKKVIAAGPGNPPVIVDDTADIEKAAKDIVRGASFDNNVLCIAEKEVFVMRAVEGKLIAGMIAAGAYLLSDREIEQVTARVLQDGKDGVMPNKAFVGKSALHILKESGISPASEPELVICRTNAEHPLVTTEMLMPIVPIVAVETFEDAVDCAIAAENGCFHTAIMHSKNVDRLTIAAQALDTTIFVKNGPSFAGLGFEGEGYTTLTISTPTGEGLTSAKDFVRARRCTLSGAFHIL